MKTANPLLSVRGMTGAVVLLLGLALGAAKPAWAQTDTSAVQPLKDLQEQFSTDGAPLRASADVVAVATRLDRASVRAGAAFEIFVTLQVAEGWHVNAHRPASKYLIGTALDVAPHPHLRIAEAYYPNALRRVFSFARDTLDVYEGEAVVILSARAAPAMPPGAYTLAATLRVQACNDQVCLRPSTIDVPIPVEVR